MQYIPFQLRSRWTPALRGKSGGDRYGFKSNSAADNERCRKHNIYLVNIARTLRLLAGKGIPWILGIPFHHADLVSALDLDEYISLLKFKGVSQIRGVQCPFGAPAATPTTFISFGVDIQDMPTACPHPLRRWKYPDSRHCSTLARHPPATGRHDYTRLWPSRSAKDKAVVAKQSGTCSTAPCSWNRCIKKDRKVTNIPALLNRFIAARLQQAAFSPMAKRKHQHQEDGNEYSANPGSEDIGTAPTADTAMKRMRCSFSEKVTFTQPLRGTIPLTDKEIADKMAIGGLRNAPDSVSRLQTVAAFGLQLGQGIRQLLRSDSDKHTAAGTSHNLGSTRRTTRLAPYLRWQHHPRRRWRRCEHFSSNIPP